MSKAGWEETYALHKDIAASLREIFMGRGYCSNSDIARVAPDRNVYRVKKYLKDRALIDFPILSDYDRSLIEKCQKMDSHARDHGGIDHSQARAILGVKGPVTPILRKMKDMGLSPPQIITDPIPSPSPARGRPSPSPAPLPPITINIGDRLNVAGMLTEYRGMQGDKPRYMII